MKGVGALQRTSWCCWDGLLDKHKRGVALCIPTRLTCTDVIGDRSTGESGIFGISFSMLSAPKLSSS